MFIMKKLLWLLLVFLIAAVLLPSCKEEMTEKEALEVQQLVDEIIEEGDNADEPEKEEPEEEEPEEPPSVIRTGLEFTDEEIEEINDLWPLEIPVMYDFGQPAKITCSVSKAETYLSFRFAYGEDISGQQFLEDYGPKLFGYVPEWMYHLDKPGEDVEVKGTSELVLGIDVSQNSEDLDVGCSSSILFTLDSSSDAGKGINDSIDGIITLPDWCEVLPEAKKISQGLSYDFETKISETNMMWRLSEEEYADVIEWIETEFADNPGYERTENEQTNVTIIDFDFMTKNDEEYSVLVEGYNETSTFRIVFNSPLRF